MVIDVLFLRALINGALADAFGGLQRTNVANEALNVVVSLVQAAANDTRGGQAGERYGRGQGMAEMRRLRNAFLKRDPRRSCTSPTASASGCLTPPPERRANGPRAYRWASC